MSSPQHTPSPAPPAAGLPPAYGPPLSLTAARKIMAAAETEAERHGWPMVIAIVDSTAHLVMLHRMEQAQLGSIAIAQAKAETSARFRRPTKAFQDVVAEGGAGLRILTMDGVSALEGGLPLMVRGEVVGAIGVSGMQSSQDAEVARAGAAALPPA
ncbi:MAG: GlcG/HbpS family heme-binding protein [Gemmatimonadales bacterium]